DLKSFETFAEAASEARRLADKFSVAIRVRCEGGRWIVSGAFCADDPGQWRDNIVRAEYLDRLLHDAEARRREAESLARERDLDEYVEPHESWTGNPDYDETSYGWYAWFNSSQG